MRPISAPPPEPRAVAASGGAVASAGWIAPATIAALIVAAILLGVGPILRAGLWLEQPNEGWNGGHALNAFSAALYPARDSLFINNYPPLWFWLTGGLARVFGDPIFAGRAVAFAAFAGVAVSLFALARRLGLGVGAALVGALVFVVTAEAYFGLYVGLAEPQMLAHALAAAAAAIVVGTRSRRVVALAAVLVVVALLVKQVVVGLPIACTIWLWVRRRDLAIIWILVGATTAMVAFAFLAGLYSPTFVQNLTTPRYLSAERLGTSLGLTARVAIPLVVFAAVAVLTWRRWGDAMTFAALAIGAAFVPLVVFGSALGVSINIGLDLAIAASLGFAAAWARLEAAAPQHAALWRGAAVVVFIAVALATSTRGALAPAIDPAARRALAAESASLAALRDRVAAVKGPAVCETLSVCVWAGRPSQADLWKLHHEQTLAFLDPAPMMVRLKAGDYAAVTTLKPVLSPADDGRLPGLYAALHGAYQPPIAFANGRTLYLSRTTP